MKVSDMAKNWVTFASNFSFRPQALQTTRKSQKNSKILSVSLNFAPLKVTFSRCTLDLRNVALLLSRNIKIYLNIKKKIHVNRALKLRNLIEAVTDPWRNPARNPARKKTCRGPEIPRYGPVFFENTGKSGSIMFHETQRVRRVSGTVFSPIRTFSVARKIRSPDTSLKRGVSRPWNCLIRPDLLRITTYHRLAKPIKLSIFTLIPCYPVLHV